jgi:pilus assembly protein FimV
MVNTSKILTVSYGTFSCTLEGFDDSFETMKAIAEYFRDLSAGDRYFGAEPPTPDAEMLARIAEREIARRVDAHEESGKIHLRAAQPAIDQPRPEPAVQEPATDPDPESAQAGAPVHEVRDVPEQAFDALHEAEEAADPDLREPEFDTALSADGMAKESFAENNPAEDTAKGTDERDGVAARLRRIRSVVDQWNTGFDTEEYSEDEHALDLVKREAQSEADARQKLPQQAETEPAEAAANRATTDKPTEPEEFETEALIASEMRESAAEQIEDLDATERTRETPAADGTEDIDLAVLAETTQEREEAEDDLTALTQALSSEQEPAAEEAAQDMDATQIGTADDASEHAETVEASEEPEHPEEGGFSEPAEDTLAQLLADAMPAEEMAADSETPPWQGEAVQEERDAADEEPITAAISEDQRPLRARVVKMKRSEFEAAIAAGEIEESAIDTLGGPTAESDDDIEPPTEASAVLSPEEEAELQRELAAVEAEMAMNEATGAPEAARETSGLPEDMEPVENEGAPEPHSRGADRLKDSAGERDVSRLFTEAANQFEAPDSSKRRNAIQHLRAAVAATKAERKGIKDLREETSEDPYRSDLAAVVRDSSPRADQPEQQERSARPNRVRPGTERDGVPRTRRPAEERPAPLKLVAEQRVDTPRAPVRPRRVAASQMAVERETVTTSREVGFSAFAEQIGATDLAELLEAAAAYMADVEGREQFSRPMLMGKLKELDHIDSDSFSREDGLRSFGHLLREGKLQKVRGGRFAVTDHTEFRAEARRAG